MTRRAGSDPEETKKQILEAATEEFSDHGFKNASLRHICARAGVTTGALYTYFQDKDALFTSVISPVTDTILHLLRSHYEAELAATSENTLSGEDEDMQATLQILHFYYTHKTLCQMLLQNQEHPAVTAFFDELIRCMDRHTLRLFQQMSGNVPENEESAPDTGAVHWFSHIQVDAILYLISHDLDPRQAEQLLEKMIRFMRAGFLSVFPSEYTEP